MLYELEVKEIPFYPPKKPIVSVKLVQDEDKIPYTTKRGEEKTKTVLKPRWNIPILDTYIEYYKSSHINLETNGEDKRWFLSSFTIPKILPQFLGIIFFRYIRENYPSDEDIFKYTFDTQIITYNKEIPCLLSGTGKIQVQEGEEIIDKTTLGFRSMILGTDKDNPQAPIGDIYKSLYNIYLDRNACYVFLDSINLNKIFKVLKCIEDICYTNTKDGLMKRNEDTNEILLVMETYRMSKSEKTRGKRYIFFDDLRPESRKKGEPEQAYNDRVLRVEKFKGLLLKYYTTSNVAYRKRMEGSGNKQYINRIMTIKLLKKKYVNLFEGDEKLYSNLRKKGTVYIPIQSDERLNLIVNYYASMARSLDVFLACCKGYRFKAKKSKLVGKRTLITTDFEEGEDKQAFFNLDKTEKILDAN